MPRPEGKASNRYTAAAEIQFDVNLVKAVALGANQAVPATAGCSAVHLLQSHPHAPARSERRSPGAVTAPALARSSARKPTVTDAVELGSAIREARSRLRGRKRDGWSDLKAHASGGPMPTPLHQRDTATVDFRRYTAHECQHTATGAVPRISEGGRRLYTLCAVRSRVHGAINLAPAPSKLVRATQF